MPELNVAEKLTEEQRTQALDRILLQLAQTNDLKARRALAAPGDSGACAETD
jgi:hypothetical protein